VQLVRVTSGQSRTPPVARSGWSVALAVWIGRIPKLIVRVRFSSPAPRDPSSKYWFSAHPRTPGTGARAAAARPLPPDEDVLIDGLTEDENRLLLAAALEA
jgi:hypothetical protein